MQGKQAREAHVLVEDALAVQEAGAVAVVLECIPDQLARYVTELLDIPTIGIGAGPGTSGQVLVYHDLLGIYPSTPRFVREFAAVGEVSRNAVQGYVEAVQSRQFPAPEHTVNMSDVEWQRFCVDAKPAGALLELEQEPTGLGLAVGDSVGMVVHGRADTIAVTMDEMVVATKATTRVGCTPQT